MITPSLVHRRLLAMLAFTAVVVATPIAVAALTPAEAQVAARVQSALEPYGHWVRHARWGEVWVPAHRPRGWRPYSAGRWVYTEEWGWYWVADPDEQDWGWLTFHYGRWVFDRRLGWFWVPGDEWAPAWVGWRRGRDIVGWAPLPPQALIGAYDNTAAYWMFVSPRDLLAQGLFRRLLSPTRARFVFRETMVVNRTMRVPHGRIAVNPGVSPALIAAVRRSAIPTFRVSPHVLVGTYGVAGAVTVRPRDLSQARRQRALAPMIERSGSAIEPAKRASKPRPLGRNEPGRLGPLPPRAAAGAAVVPRAAPAAPPPQPKTPPRPRYVAPLPPSSEHNQRAPVTRQGEPPPQAKPTQPMGPLPPVHVQQYPPPQAIRPAPPPRPLPPAMVRPAPPKKQAGKKNGRKDDKKH